jgi:GT2 family glycosyltransferase
MQIVTIDVLMTCHNRREQTISCLNSLFQFETDSLRFEVYLVDDGSQDLTREAVSINFPKVNIIEGSGVLFWAAGMALAEASIKNPSAWTLWLNDDLILNPETLNFSKLLANTGQNCISIGQISDRLGNFLYGGTFQFGILKDNLKSVQLESYKNREPRTFNGNFVLMPLSVRKKLGPIDGGFSHGYADMDYGLRAKKIGIKIQIIPGYIAQSLGTTEYGVTPERTSFKQLIKSPKGQPLNDQIRFFRRHAKFVWIIYVLIPFLRILKYKLLRFFTIH